MTLAPSATAPGLWENPTWRPGTPGLFAVVIGVSAYDHLRGGSGSQAADSYDLGQLFVSASTAFRFFQWLKDAYDYPDCPLAKCWLLLAPTSEEEQQTPRLHDLAMKPTFAGCEQAIGAWFATMKQLPRGVGERSRLLFFFSGHGLEVYQGNQVLLPADYLKPPEELVTKALGTQNLQLGLQQLWVGEQFFFVDACRNDHRRLRQAALKGYPILAEWTGPPTNKDLNAVLLYASGMGNKAWQPRDPTRLSLFGQALLEGLRAEAGFRLDCDASPCPVRLFSLLPFVSDRVTSLLRDYQTSQTNVRQPVRTGGHLAQTTITNVVPAARPEAPPPPAIAVVDQQFTSRVSLEAQVAGGWGFEGGAAPDPFADEQMAALWSAARIYGLRTGSWREASQALTLYAVERAGTQSYRIILSVRGAPEDVWFQLKEGDQTIACVLPWDQIDARYLIEVDRDADGTVASLEASLALDNEGLLGQAATLWQRYQAMGPGAVADRVAPRLLADALVPGQESRLAATIAAIVLLRASRWEALDGRLRTLVTWFRDLPDAPVLEAERRLWRTPGGEASASASEAFLELGVRGLPLTVEAFAYAAGQGSRLLASSLSGGEQRRSLEAVQRRLDEALPTLHPVGLFTTFAGARGAIAPELVLP